MNLIHALGALAGIISTVAFLPQAIKVWRLKTTHGISRMMYLLYGVSLLLWGTYAWMIQSWPLLITEIVTGIMVGYILLMTWKKEKEED